MIDRKGFERPLFETGALRDSITHNVDSNGKEAAVGTDLDYAKYLEFGALPKCLPDLSSAAR